MDANENYEQHEDAVVLSDSDESHESSGSRQPEQSNQANYSNQSLVTTNQSALGSSGRRTAEDETGGGGEINNINKIRDILFGGQVREYDRRFDRVEDRINKDLNDLKEETRRRLDSLETFFRKEVESLSVRLTAEQNTRTEALRYSSQSVRENTVILENKIAQLGDQFTRDQSDMRSELLNQSKVLRDEVESSFNDLLDALERESMRLRNEKTDRSQLAELFTEFALRLNDGPKLSDKG